MKYKLIKEYPGSPQLGNELTMDEDFAEQWKDFYQLVPEPEFISGDGIGVFVGDHYYFADDPTGDGLWATFGPFDCRGNEDYDPEDLETLFVNKLVADKYCIEHSQLLTVADIDRLLGKSMFTTFYRDKLLKIATERYAHR